MGRYGVGTYGSATYGDDSGGGSVAPPEPPVRVPIGAGAELIKLVLDTDEITLLPNDEIDVTTFNLGYPTVRDVVYSKPNAHGERDRARLFGPRVISMDMNLLAITRSPNAIKADLDKFFTPGRRPILVYKLIGQDERYIQVYSTQASGPLEASSPSEITLSTSWKAPDPFLRSTEWNSVLVNPIADGAGIEFDFEFDFEFPGAGTVGPALARNIGPIEVYPIIRIYGPCTNPKITNETLNQIIAFDDMSISEGDYVEIDIQNERSYVNGDFSNLRDAFIDYDVTRWWNLAVGDNLIRFHPDSFGGNSQVHVRWQTAWIT